jgi:uncharacterized protein
MSNVAVPLSPDLSREALVAELRALRPAFERTGVKGMTLIGSRARRDNRSDSDIDLVITVDDDQAFSLLDVAHIYGLIESRLGLESSILTRRSLDDDFLRSIARDEVPVF